MSNISITTLPASPNQNNEAVMLTELVVDLDDDQCAQIKGGSDAFETCLYNESKWLGSWGAVPFCGYGWAIAKVVQ
ncbi:hypothetical protein [Microcoleus sp. F4-D5]|uniref:hypothetical protein n=1 Tax=Microcoleus sp. F4-D5 TaxID=2818760 RepID=UPI002FD6D557